MATNRFVRHLAAVAVVVALAGCASSGGSEAAPAADAAATPGLVLNVQNDHAGANTITVFLEPVAGGVRQSLGTVEAGASRSFRPTVAAGAQFTLVIQTPSGESRSERFTVQGATTANWDMSTRRLTVTRR